MRFRNLALVACLVPSLAASLAVSSAFAINRPGARAPRVVVYRDRYSAGFFLDQNGCKFLQPAPLDDISTILTIQHDTKSNIAVFRAGGRFPFTTTLKGTGDATKFTVRGEATQGTRLIREAMRVRIRGKKGTATLTGTVIDGGERCSYVYEGTLSR